MEDSGAESAVVPEVDLAAQVLEEEVRAVVVLVEEAAVAGAVDAAAEAGAEIRMAAVVLIMDSSRASATGGVSSLLTRVPFLSRCKTRH